MARGGARAGREDEVAGLLAHHWLGADDEDKAIHYLTRAGDRARQEYALDEAIAHYRELLPLLERRGERQRDRARAVQARARAAHVAAVRARRTTTYQRAFDFWTPPAAPPEPPTRDAARRDELPAERPRPALGDRVAEHPALHAAVRPARRAVAGADDRALASPSAGRSPTTACATCSTCARGSRWSDGAPLTAHDVEFGIKRVLEPATRRARRSRSTSCWSTARTTTSATTTDADAIGVRALDDRTVEFRLVAPAPYFMSVMNRPDGGPQPRHAIEAARRRVDRAATQVVSGAFRDRRRGPTDVLVLERRAEHRALAAGQRRPRSSSSRSPIADAVAPYARDELDLVAVRYTPRLADLVPGDAPRRDRRVRPAWSGYLAFDHARSRRRRTSTCAARSRTRSTARRSAARLPAEHGRRERRDRPAGAAGPHARHRACGSIPTSRGRSAALGSVEARLAVAVPRRRSPRCSSRCIASWREVLGLEVEIVHLDARQEIATMPPPTELAPIVLHGLAARATPTPSTSCGCCSTRTAGRTRAGSPSRRSTT